MGKSQEKCGAFLPGLTSPYRQLKNSGVGQTWELTRIQCRWSPFLSYCLSFPSTPQPSPLSSLHALTQLEVARAPSRHGTPFFPAPGKKAPSLFICFKVTFLAPACVERGPGLLSIGGGKEPTTVKTNRTDVLLLPPGCACAGMGPKPPNRVPPSGSGFRARGNSRWRMTESQGAWGSVGSPGTTCRALQLTVPSLSTVIPLTVALLRDAFGLHPLCSHGSQDSCRSWSQHTVSNEFFFP